MKNFCTYVHEKFWPIVFFLVMSLSGLDIRVMLASKNSFRGFPSASIFRKRLLWIGIISSLNVLYNSPVKLSETGAFFWKIINYWSSIFNTYRSIQIILFSLRWCWCFVSFKALKHSFDLNYLIKIIKLGGIRWFLIFVTY